ncbi:MAG: PIN domain-containing protein [Verrucomicrobia bacterium]|nr:PIN domain-containing protein [Verrucomicrobiota bacterium]
MKYLLDVNVLLAAAWANHPQYATADAWLEGKSVVVCPLAELGFLRISTHKKAIAASMEDARRALEKFLSETKATRIADDLPALESHAENSEQVTDQYLATLADRHGYKMATLDGGIKHTAVELIAAAK